MWSVCNWLEGTNTLKSHVQHFKDFYYLHSPPAIYTSYSLVLAFITKNTIIYFIWRQLNILNRFSIQGFINLFLVMKWKNSLFIVKPQQKFLDMLEETYNFTLASDISCRS